MSFTGRIRLYLIAIALLPPLLMMLVVYSYSSQQQEIRYRQNAAEDVAKLMRHNLQFRENMISTVDDILDHSWFERSVRLASRNRARDISFADLAGFRLDFCELLDSAGKVVASAHRPGLVGASGLITSGTVPADETQLMNTVEIDVRGRHAAFVGAGTGSNGYTLYCGRYLETALLPIAGQLVRGRLDIRFHELSEQGSTSRAEDIEPGMLYFSGDTLRSLLWGGPQAEFEMTAMFSPPDESTLFASFINVVSVVALVSVLAAIGLGLYISGRARREFDNLIDGFSRVAEGDLKTPVMAYSEGEFSELADSFSAMTRKLHLSQEQLATTQKIAAWQSMARKIAHEIKNPLTPIGISADDLRRSYAENLPGFDQTLDKSTRMIKEEVGRLATLLDEFVSFARMKAPEKRPAKLMALVDDLRMLYRGETQSGRVSINISSKAATWRLDPELIKQVLVNLIKNGIEAGETTITEVIFSDSDSGLNIRVADNGPGFDQNILQRQFEPYLSTKKSGSGLGLVICQRIINDHGGSIELGNGKNGGAEVTIELPLT